MVAVSAIQSTFASHLPCLGTLVSAVWERSEGATGCPTGGGPSGGVLDDARNSHLLGTVLWWSSLLGCVPQVGKGG